MTATDHVVVVDPSLYTLPYDDHLCAALCELGCKVTLAGRNLRLGEQFRPTAYAKLLQFYPLSERFRNIHLPGWLHGSIKGIEHIYGMFNFNASLKSLRPSIIHFQWLPIPFFDGLCLNRLREHCPLVLTVHDSNPYNGSPHASLQIAGTTQAIKKFDQIIVHTLASRNRLIERGIEPEKLAIVPHGLLNADTANQALTAARSARATGKKTTLLLFGKIKPYKGYDTLLEAIALMSPAEREQLSVRIVGEPCMDIKPLLNKVAQAGLTDTVEIRLGFYPTHAIPKLFNEVDAFIFPYSEIDASGALFECLPYAKPIIASRVGIFAELLVDGKQGYLTDPGNAIQLSKALLKIKPNNADYFAMVEEVKRLATDMTNWQQIAGMTVAVYEKAIGKRAST